MGEPRYIRVLSLDGGGVRGIVPGQVLVALERKLKAASGDPDTRIADHFDLVAGTSTGGILTCLYLTPDSSSPTRPRFSAEEAVEIYLENGDDIFDIPLLHRIRSGSGLVDERYPSEGIEEVLESYFGELMLSELLKPCLVTAYDIKRRQTHFFTQHDAKANRAYDFLVREVARSTSAAPTYFECARATSASRVRYPLIDGGVFANNPALCAYAEARNLPARPTAKDMVILSLGTGQSKKAYYYKEAKDWGTVEWLRPVLDIIMSGVSETVDYQLGQIYDAVGLPDQYLRIQPRLHESNAEMDNVEMENLIALQEIGAEAAINNEAALDRIVDFLLARA